MAVALICVCAFGGLPAEAQSTQDSAQAQTQSEMNSRAAKEFRAADKALNDAWGSAKSFADAIGQGDALLEAQRLWLAYRDAACETYAGQDNSAALTPAAQGRNPDMTNVLDQLRTMTTVVADTGEVAAVKTYKPVDCTTNPSLVLKALTDPASEALVVKEIEAGKAAGLNAEAVTEVLTVAMGAELAALVPGRVPTEVDACLSFDTEASVARARAIIAEYEKRGVNKSQVLIKLASTWEGIRAAEILQGEGIDCNLTLLFSMAQAVACADAKSFLISPFVGRITDWYKKAEGRDHYAPDEDPGVKSVRAIYDYYKSNGIPTIVMGASFRSVDQIKALAG
eukprot:maker-scaffold11500_size2009-snap-gene-0.2 protein:Tk08703 transcript:maker-scaffold11500_size2009-snap-gene-0.2-mRNA-1 annotation:"transaldolase protein"